MKRAFAVVPYFLRGSLSSLAFSFACGRDNVAEESPPQRNGELAATSAPRPTKGEGGGPNQRECAQRNVPKYVFVIALENRDSNEILNSPRAPYFNEVLRPKGASAEEFLDVLPLGIPSEPHYVWLEAGTNEFSDTTFLTNDPPSVRNSTSSKEHLTTRLIANGHSWRTYQEGIDETAGACPIHASGFYQPKHNPFVFFRDVAGDPPDENNAYCRGHTRPLSSLRRDVAEGDVAAYTWITPDQCHDMHGQSGCPDGDPVVAGDAWLSTTLPPLLDFLERENGVLFLVWDEGSSAVRIPFLALGPSIRPGYVSKLPVNHSSVVKTITALFALVELGTTTNSNSLADFFLPCTHP